MKQNKTISLLGALIVLSTVVVMTNCNTSMGNGTKKKQDTTQDNKGKKGNQNDQGKQDNQNNQGGNQSNQSGKSTIGLEGVVWQLAGDGGKSNPRPYYYFENGTMTVALKKETMLLKVYTSSYKLLANNKIKIRDIVDEGTYTISGAVLTITGSGNFQLKAVKVDNPTVQDIKNARNAPQG